MKSKINVFEVDKTKKSFELFDYDKETWQNN